MLKTTNNALLLATLACLTLTAQAQDKKGDAKTPPPSATPPKPAEAPKTGPKPYKEVITDKAKTSKGLFTVHKVEDKFYFEIADSLMGREIMTVTRISKTGTIPGAYGGEQLNRQVINFEKGPDSKIFLRAIQYINVSTDSTAPMYKAVQNSNLQPIAQAFDVKALRKDSVSKQGSTVIDVSDFFKGDNQIISLSSFSKSMYKITSLAADRSYIQSIKTFPINTEIKMVKTFNGSPPTPSFGPPSPSPIPSVNIPAISAAGAITMDGSFAKTTHEATFL
jgi:Domain of unknown function (DUF5117)/Domain of unknown function (DUF5118)